jgi:hypothetical protein
MDDRKPAKPPADAPRKRRRYEKPCLATEKIFEATALACGKTPGRGGLCLGAPRVS